MAVLVGHLSVPQGLSGARSSRVAITGDLTIGEHVPVYTGNYTIIPSLETQTLEVLGKQCAQNITIEPIPSNYGLITWSGSVLTVS